VSPHTYILWSVASATPAVWSLCCCAHRHTYKQFEYEEGFGGNPFRCVAVRKFTGKGVMRADEGTRFTYKGKKIYHFMVRSCSHTVSQLS
jgi:hypothetical protein